MEERLIGGRYRVTGTLGHGGMASVYRAVDEQLGREVAVKLFRIGPVDHGERARAEAEIQVLAGLRSPNLVTLFDAALDDADGDSFLVMELVPGSDLATRLREGPLDPTTTARVGAQVAEGLAAVHAQGIVHRDVKPANVLLEQDGEHVKLADFGIALLRDAARVTGTGTVIGTAAYLAPEQVLGQPVTGEADVYALGLMLLEALTGKQAYEGSAVEAATARLARAPEIDQRLPTAWRTLLHVMTAQHPEDRPSAAEAAARLRALGRDEVAPATQLLPGGPGALTRAAAGAGVAGAAAAAVGAGAGAASADEATRQMPVSGASRPDDATRRLPTQAQPARSADDDVATTILGTPAAAAAGPGAGGTSGGGTAAPARPIGTDPDEPRRKRWVLPLIILAVLLVAGIVIAAVAFNRDDSTTPTPTESTQQTAPTDEQPSSEPSDESSEPVQQQPSQPAEQPSEQPSEPAQEEPSDEPSQPADESSEPTDPLPTTAPEPGTDTTLPVQDPLDTGVDTTSEQAPVTGGAGGPGGATGAGGATGPGKSGEAPGHNKGRG